MKADPEFLRAALAGYQSELVRIEQAMAEIRRQLRPSAGNPSNPAALEAKGKMSRAKEAPAKKRKLSAAGRKRIVEATKKRWAAYRAQKAKA